MSRGYLQEDLRETFMRYIPKSEVEALKADLVEETVKESEAQGNGEIKAEPATPAPGQADTGEGPAAATGRNMTSS